MNFNICHAAGRAKESKKLGRRGRFLSRFGIKNNYLCRLKLLFRYGKQPHPPLIAHFDKVQLRLDRIIC